MHGIKQLHAAAPASSNGRRALYAVLTLLCLVALLGGCSRFRRNRNDIVYVSVQKKFLVDRVAVVSNHVCEVQNGERLEVLERWRRFLKVKTQNNQIGWIEAVSVISSQEYQGFADLAKQYEKNPVVSTGVLRDDSTLHLLPGRQTVRFYYLAANAKIQLIQRASVPKNPSAQPAAASSPAPAQSASRPAGSAPAASGQKTTNQPAANQASTNPAPVPAAPAMEDWWLVRDSDGHTGWLLASRIDVTLPDEILIYAERQRIIGAYVLKNIADPEAPGDKHEFPEYVVLTAQPVSGLPYDFDQVRVYTWNPKKHRYETAYRLKPIPGYLPVTVEQQNGYPVFTLQLGNGSMPAADPKTGIWHPASTRTLRFALMDTVVKRVGPDLNPIQLVHAGDTPGTDSAKKKSTKKKPAR